MEETWRSLLPIMELNLLLVARVLKIGVVEYCLTSATGKDSSTKMLMKIKWNQRKEADLLPPYNECPTLYHHFIMNIIAWNCRGALKPSFQEHIRDLVQNHDPAIMVVIETKVGRARAKESTDRLSFNGAICTETIGYAGGLWLLWNSNRVEVETFAYTEQETHAEVKVRSSNLTWILSAIYASPKSDERCVLWENLTKVAELHKLPWIMARDFNEPLVDGDKFGGRGVSINRSSAFKDCLNRCSMVDLGFLGPRYTWTNKREFSNLIMEIIDRFFMNPDWCMLYPDAKVSHLPRCHFDHCQILLEALPNRAMHLTRPFRFQEFWLSDTTFPRVVSQAWSRRSNLAESIECFSQEATLWNKNHFGNIFYKKKRILARLYGALKALANNLRPSLFNLENQLQKDLEEVLDQEWDLWMLKSILNWMIQGDRNTSIYHVSTLARRKRNLIASVKVEGRVWITEEKEVMDYFRRRFTNLYTIS
ncbi:uncharacterized protein LOC136065446 [Quercus suber]|uniref:uncharacterized protein LOC111994313 n=1 Tax=Quercus suber TaxID=58331 RepID=UPI000CE1CF48|nr:uncharacterized protein LOC111994313 [Quercus suber]